MKQIDQTTKEWIAKELSRAAGYAVSGVRPELFLSPEFGAFRAHVSVANVERRYILKIDEALTGTVKEVEMKWVVMKCAFVNREHEHLMATFGAS
jgi:hypothetical protein